MSKDKKPEIDIFNAPLSNNAKKSIEKNIASSTKQIQTIQTSAAPDTLTMLSGGNELMSNISSHVNNIYSNITNISDNADVTSGEIDSMILMAKKEVDSNQLGKKNRSKKLDQELENLKSSVTDGNTDNIEQLMQLHKAKTMDAIATYNLIIKIVPKMRLLLNSYATSILSPDDLTSSKLNIRIKEDGELENEQRGRIIEKASVLFDKYDVNKTIRNDIISYLINGKLFYLVTSVNKELLKSLNEESETMGVGLYRTLNEETDFSSILEASLTENTKNPNQKNNILIENFKDAFTLQEADSAKLSEAAKRLDTFLNDEFVIGNVNALLDDSSESSLNEETVIQHLSSSFSGSSYTAASDDKKDGLVTEKQLGTNNKAIVRKISPSNIIPLEYNNKVFGYIHLDIIEIDPDGDVMPVDSSTDEEGFGMSPSLSSIGGNSNLINGIISNTADIATNSQGGSNGKASDKNYENPTSSPGLGMVDDARLEFIAKVFTNRLSKETNLKLIKKSDTLKNAIYNGLAVKKIGSNQKIRIVYLTPEEVVYIDRGHSIFDNVLFFCKIYIATLITILMQNVLNGGEKRAVYVEVGDDNNAAQAVNRVIKDIRSRDVGSVMGMDVNSILNIQRQSQAYYIPVIEGEKPISFETIDSLSNKSIDDEFLNWLGGQIYSGMGTPTAYLNEIENVDFAKILSMQNSRYLRECLTEQLTLNPGYTELLRKIYQIEYADYLVNDNKLDNNRSSNDDDIISPSLLEVQLPVPSALALYSISEQLNNAQQVVDVIIQNTNIANTADILPEDEEKLKNHVRNDLIRNFASSVKWGPIDNVIKTAVNNFKETAFRNKMNDPAEPTAEDDTEGF